MLCRPAKAIARIIFPARISMITESSRSCDIKVIGSDRLRWSVYEGDKIYLLNTDYDMPITVKVIKGEAEKSVTLDSLELRAVEFEEKI